MAQIAGVDGCRAGWMTVWREVRTGSFGLRIFPDLVALEAALSGVQALAIDMPIGLPDAILGPGRAPEKAVRPLLGARQSSVFSIPARAAVEAADYGEACREALAASDPPRKVAKQGFNIFPKIMELDRFLRERPGSADRVIETHPEVVFRRIKGEPLEHPKKVAEGRAERLRLLAEAGLPLELLTAIPPRGAAPDDLVDAMACLLTAERHARGEAVPHPPNPGRDRFGLPMAIWA